MITQLSKYWWTFLLRGLCALLIGICVIVWPASLIFFFALFALVDGLFALVAAISGYGKDNRVTPTWWLVMTGICGVIAGICALKYPLMSLEILVIFIAAWTLTTGLFSLFGSFDMPKGSGGKGMFIFNAVASIIFGLLVLVWPVSGAFAIAWFVAFYAILGGCTLTGLAFRIRSDGKKFVPPE